MSLFNSVQSRGRPLRFILSFVGIIALLLVNSWLLNSNFEKVSEQEQRVAHTANVLSEIDLFVSAAKDTETGVRGYFITHRTNFLEPYEQGSIAARDHIAQVMALTVDNPSQQAGAKNLIALFDERMDDLKQLIDLANKIAGGTKGDNGTSVALMERSKVAMDELRAQAKRMQDTERDYLKSRSSAAERSRSFFFWILLTTSLLSIAVVTLAFQQFMLAHERTEAESKVKSHEAWLKSGTAEVTRLVSGDLSVQQAGDRALQFLARELGVIAARVYLIEGKQWIEISSEGVSDRATDASWPLLQKAQERGAVWEIDDIPANYWKIASGLGESLPRSLVFVPFYFQGRALGVIEMAAMTKLRDRDRELLQVITDSIAVGLSAAQSRQRLKDLLAVTQQQAEEMQTQQEELKTSNEELEQQARALESQQQTLNIKNEQLEQTQRDLKAKAVDLERSGRYKSDFLAKMSHELRTPLNGLMILSALLAENKEKNLTDQQKQFATSIRNAGNDLLTLINDILDLSKIEARKLSLRPESFALVDLTEQLRLTFEPQAQSKMLKLNLQVSEEAKMVRIHTDRLRLEQVLRNFLSNAIKFTEAGQIGISVSLVDGGKSTCFAISDTGVGIPQDKQALVFEAFEQADSSVSRRFGGTGLGLTISRELAELLGGRIELKSAEGKGSTFSVIVPNLLAASATAGDSGGYTSASVRSPSSVIVKPSAVKTGTNDAPLNIDLEEDSTALTVRAQLTNVDQLKRSLLIVEDDDQFRASVVEVARGYNFQVLEAATGEVALGILEKHTPSAVLLDIRLPGISGFGVLEMMKQMGHLRHVPVHMISALDYQPNALRLGALGYLSKPVTIEKVRSALDRIENLISGRVRRLLLIEDDSTQSEAISALVSGKDVQVTTATTGTEAIENLKVGSFDCIVLDLSLPDTNGFDLLEKFSRLQISLPPVVIYTAKDLTEEEEEYLRKFSESIIIKGARSPERLLDEVNLFLHRVETLLPQEKQKMLSDLRSQEHVFEGKTVLIVDDDLRNSFALTHALESRKLTVRIAKNGLEALEALEEHADIDLVLMDIMMPKMDGFEAMRRIRLNQNSRIKRVPIIALTAKAMREDHERCIEAGANDYLPKPVVIEKLITALRVWLSGKGFFS